MRAIIKRRSELRSWNPSAYVPKVRDKRKRLDALYLQQKALTTKIKNARATLARELRLERSLRRSGQLIE